MINVFAGLMQWPCQAKDFRVVLNRFRRGCQAGKLLSIKQNVKYQETTLDYSQPVAGKNQDVYFVKSALRREAGVEFSAKSQTNLGIN
jgi:hypothetical protein